MPKLIPISSKQMKAMGIVQSKNGFLMREHKPVSSSKAPKEDFKSKVKEARKESVKKDVSPVVKSKAKPQPVREVVVVQKNAKQLENKRMEDRGIY